MGIVIALTDPGTNRPAVLAALQKINSGVSEGDAKQLLAALPQTVLSTAKRQEADAAVKALSAAGAKASFTIIPQGPDLARGWGKRRTVAEDFLYDERVLLGAQRVGPDLANVGVRLPDVNWQLRHLYWPRSEVKGSCMPAYRFLFEKRPKGGVASSEALVFPPGTDPGCEVVPTPDARAGQPACGCAAF